MAISGKLNPFVLRREIRKQLRNSIDQFLKPGNLLADVGCGASPFSRFCADRDILYAGIDKPAGFYGETALDIVGIADSLPLTDSSVDAVLSSQVLEHLDDPEKSLGEIRRVLKTGGYAFISFPFLFPLHAAPHDYYRYTEYGFEAICKRQGFEVVKSHRSSGFWYIASVLCELPLSAINKLLFRKLPVIPLLSLPLHWLFWVFHQVEGLICGLLGKNVNNIRQAWTANYVYVIAKRPYKSR